MNDEIMLDYRLGMLDADERLEVEAYLLKHPVDRGEIERFQVGISLLEMLRDDPEPPTNLAVKTIVRLAGILVESEKHLLNPDTAATLSRSTSVPIQPFKLLESDRAVPSSSGGRFRIELLVAASIAFLATGLIFSFVNRIRSENEVYACQNNLMILHQGLHGYADTHFGRFPQVGSEAYPVAESFLTALADSGQYPQGFHPSCPAALPENTVEATLLASDSGSRRIGYAYALGHVGPNGTLVGPYRSPNPADENDLIPVSSDYPINSAVAHPGPTSPHRLGHNVLFAAGNVRYLTTANVGVNGDDIFRNQRGQVAAGVDRTDSVLGFAGDRP